MKYTAQLYYNSALALKLPCVAEKIFRGFYVHLAGRRYFINGARTPFNFCNAESIAANKYYANKLLEQGGIPVPKATFVNREMFELDDWDRNAIQYPVVAKPTSNTAMGEYVFCNIKNQHVLENYLKKIFSETAAFAVSVEAFKPNLKSYRILVFQNKVIGVVERIPAYVVGDGVHTLQALIDLTNSERKFFEKKMPLGPIKIEEEQLVRLAEQGVTLDDIPLKNQRIDICYKCNSSCGGTMGGVDGEICSENTALAIKAAKILELGLVGFDVLCQDIGKPILSTAGYFIEANTAPDVSIHENALFGNKNCVTRKILFGLIKRHPISYFFHRVNNISRLSFYVKLILFFLGVVFFSHKIVF
ncbi:MAG: UDP-N-acetylmuramyl peptide synthase [Gammaproteobacteria bacterium]|nr:UDP-N-acetylmuramyl peptide synthase [Gammaproteobacteria bacterium]